MSYPAIICVVIHFKISKIRSFGGSSLNSPASFRINVQILAFFVRYNGPSRKEGAARSGLWTAADAAKTSQAFDALWAARAAAAAVAAAAASAAASGSTAIPTAASTAPPLGGDAQPRATVAADEAPHSAGSGLMEMDVVERSMNGLATFDEEALAADGGDGAGMLHPLVDLEDLSGPCGSIPHSSKPSDEACESASAAAICGDVFEPPPGIPRHSVVAQTPSPEAAARHTQSMQQSHIDHILSALQRLNGVEGDAVAQPSRSGCADGEYGGRAGVPNGATGPAEGQSAVSGLSIPQALSIMHMGDAAGGPSSVSHGPLRGREAAVATTKDDSNDSHAGPFGRQATVPLNSAPSPGSLPSAAALRRQYFKMSMLVHPGGALATQKNAYASSHPVFCNILWRKQHLARC